MIKALAVLLLVFSLPAFAALEVAGVKFEDSAKVGAGDTVINGVGLREKEFFKVYAVALYLPQKQAAAADALVAKGANIAGEEFYRALMRIWIGNQPAQDDLKEQLLGKPAG